MSRLNRAVIDASAIAHNFSVVKQNAPHARVLAMIKANGYGHGIVTMAQALKEANAFGVACLEEAVMLREAGITQPIVMMAGIFEAEELIEVSRLRLSLVIQAEWQLSAFESFRFSTPIDVWLKIDTGMHRLGFSPEECQEKLSRLRATTQCRSIGLMTHFSDADDVQSDKTLRQEAIFSRLTQGFLGPLCLANSAGILAWPEFSRHWVRPGVMLCGISPFKNTIGETHHLKPVMTLESRIFAIHAVKKGEAIGYGSQYVCEEDKLIAMVCMGYGDGYPWQAKNGTPVLIHGVLCPIVGRISMDMMAVELKVPAKVQDVVTLWGPSLPVERIAAAVGTIPYELVTKLTARVRFEVVNEKTPECV